MGDTSIFENVSNFNAIFIAYGEGRWGKGWDGTEAVKNGRIKRGMNHAVWAAIFAEETTKEEMDNLWRCITMGYDVPQFYDNRTPEDNEMIRKRFRGWLKVAYVVVGRRR